MKYEIGKEYILLNASNGAYIIRTYAGFSEDHDYTMITIHKFINTKNTRGDPSALYVKEGSIYKLILPLTPLMEALF